MHKKHFNIMFKRKIMFRKTFEIASSAKLNSRKIRKSFSLIREIKFREIFFL